MEKFRVTCNGSYTEISELLKLFEVINDLLNQGEKKITIEKIS